MCDEPIYCHPGFGCLYLKEMKNRGRNSKINRMIYHKHLLFSFLYFWWQIFWWLTFWWVCAPRKRKGGS
jgi:hypothetical protein